MNNKPFLSIITINYNNCNGLRKTIESVISQKYHNFEYIVIDGGSTDGSIDVIKEYSDKIAYWISEPDHGIYNAMNKGAAAAHGKYTLFLNSGDYLTNENILDQADTKNWKSVFVSGNIITDKGEELKTPQEVTMKFFLNGSLLHPATFIKRSLFDTRPYNEQYKIAGDWDFFLYHLIAQNASYQHIDVNIAIFDTTGISSTTRKNDHDKLLKQRAIDAILPERVREDYKCFIGEKDLYHRLFNTISKTKHKKTIYLLVVFLLKIMMLNKGWINQYPFKYTEL